jgi:hypothetical protein
MNTVLATMRSSLVLLTVAAAACGAAGQEPATPPLVTPAVPPAAPTRVVVCLPAVGATVRVYRLFYVPAPEAAAGWRLSMSEPATTEPPVEVSLPGAEPAIMASRARLDYRSAGQGVSIALDTSGDGASLSVATDAQARPGLERLATGGLVRLPPCRVETR